MTNKKRGITYVTVAAVLWAITGVCGQVLTQQRGIAPIWLGTVKLLCGGIILLSIGFIKTYKLDYKRLFRVFNNRKDAKKLLIFSAFGSGMVQISYFYAVSSSNAATATFLQYVSPAFVIVILATAYKQKPKKIEIISTVLALIGTFFIATHGSITNLAFTPAALMWGILSAVSLAFYTVYPTNIMKKYGTVIILGWSMFLVGIILSICVRPWRMMGSLMLQDVGIIAFIVLFGTVMSFLLYSIGVEYIGSAKANILATLEPLTSAILSFLLLDVKFEMADYIGFTCIISIAFLLALEKGTK